MSVSWTLTGTIKATASLGRAAFYQDTVQIGCGCPCSTDVFLFHVYDMCILPGASMVGVTLSAFRVSTFPQLNNFLERHKLLGHCSKKVCLQIILYYYIIVNSYIVFHMHYTLI